MIPPAQQSFFATLAVVRPNVRDEVVPYLSMHFLERDWGSTCN